MEKVQRQHYLYEIKDLGDERGGLVVVNSGEEVPFEVKRIFYIYNTQENINRGNHANIKSSFVMISLAGFCTVEVGENYNKKEYLLDSPTKALFISNGLWKTMKNFSKDNVLLVFSDNKYDENEYIKEYEKYISIMSKNEGKI